MSITIQHRRDTASNWTSNNPTMSAGQIGVETDTGKFKVGDGSTAWSSLDYFETATPSGPTQGAVQGSAAGFVSGGRCFTISPAIGPNNIALQSIDKINFTSDTNATDQGDLLAAFCYHQGTSSSTHGYTAGGLQGTPPSSASNVIQKFAMSSAANATDVGDLIAAQCSPGNGGGAMSQDNGYYIGGWGPGTPGIRNSYEKFPFSSDGNATDVGDQSQCAQQQGVHSSSTDAYITGGNSPAGNAAAQNITKFPFSSDANATDTGGDLTSNDHRIFTSWSTDTHGYTAGGRSHPATYAVCSFFSNAILKYPFAISSGYATDVADLTKAVQNGSGVASTTHGYRAGGSENNYTPDYSSNVIDKHCFSSGANATDVGDLISRRYDGAAGNNQI